VDKTIRRVTSFDEQQAETYRYWQGRPDHGRMEAIAEIVRDAYALKGIDLDARGSERTLVRVQRSKD
jgi:hypothetical protein